MEFLKFILGNFYLKRIFLVSDLTCSTAGWLNGFTFIKRAKSIVSKTKNVKTILLARLMNVNPFNQLKVLFLKPRM